VKHGLELELKTWKEIKDPILDMISNEFARLWIDNGLDIENCIYKVIGRITFDSLYPSKNKIIIKIVKDPNNTIIETVDFIRAE
jgi:hypothetical protein